METPDDMPIDLVRLQALQRFLEVHQAPEDKGKLMALAQWLEECRLHRQAFRELGQALEQVAEDPLALEQALQAMLMQLSAALSRH